MSNLKIFTTNIEESAQEQINTLLAQPAFADAKIRIMPDVHAGAGCVIGFTADLGEKVIPNIVGVDIGCGVRVVKFSPEAINLNLEGFDRFIKQNIPAGFAVNSELQVPAEDIHLDDLYCYPDLINTHRLRLGVGSLGGGNHFIELDIDENGFVYLVIHTGSRNLGKQVADLYQQLAIRICHSFEDDVKQLIASLKAEGRTNEIQTQLEALKAQRQMSKLPDGLCYLEGRYREAYLHDMRICQDYAVLNRSIIANKLVEYITEKTNATVLNTFESVHNYIDDNNMVRKGAISAHKGEPVIIPLNMRDGSIIGVGLGNEDWNESAPHGAGRLMSRAEAKRSLELADFKNVMSGIYTTTADLSTIDEAPMAYKNAAEIVNAIGETVQIEAIIKPIYNFKAAE